MDISLDKRYRTLIVLWSAMLMNIGIFFLVSVSAGPRDTQTSTYSTLLTFGLAALGTFLVVLSFVVKRKLLERSVNNQDVNLVQKALVIAGAMCEVAALMGLLERFILRNSDYYLLFIVAAIGTALHFPRREQLQSAAYKSLSNNQVG